MQSMNSAPCLGCAERRSEPINCHSYCERYIAFRHDKDRQIEQNRKAKEIVYQDMIRHDRIVKNVMHNKRK